MDGPVKRRHAVGLRRIDAGFLIDQLANLRQVLMLRRVREQWLCPRAHPAREKHQGNPHPSCQWLNAHGDRLLEGQIGRGWKRSSTLPLLSANESSRTAPLWRRVRG